MVDQEEEDGMESVEKRQEERWKEREEEDAQERRKRTREISN